MNVSGAWLILSCSLHMLLCILASVPTTNARLCTRQVRVETQQHEVKRIQMIRRIPAKCSSWDRSWAWLTNIDCGTKYALDYVDLPTNPVSYRTEYVCCPDDQECANAQESIQFDMTDERFLAIVFGTVAVILAILIVIIVISLSRRRPEGCSNLCRQRTTYDTSEVVEQEFMEGRGTCNEYVDEGRKLVESEYEEIIDNKGTGEISKQKLQVDESVPALPPPPYPYLSTAVGKVRGTNRVSFQNGLIPSAPYEEDLVSQTARKWVSNETLVNHAPMECDNFQRAISTGKIVEHVSEIPFDDEDAYEDHRYQNIASKLTFQYQGITEDMDETDEQNNDSVVSERSQNVYMDFQMCVSNSALPPSCTERSPSAHSYEHLDPKAIEGDGEYESLSAGSSRSEPLTLKDFGKEESGSFKNSALAVLDVCPSSTLEETDHV
ncbi:hypothetical protein CHS0354_022554 [Potamilus streckersoni]|uniref:Uncharacterized protein n=1 Tax=Potamilus streckersoni TaxID=2493646 RepID=A0AAE0TBI8_9BIVA|nr:hypothetical protein CHS0354_022554 [Potamilus streckersoni]